uniref:Uncharacterized protein n=1 Tax=Coccolithus braarudii TaxID=221442 RepID=A0A7S0Q2A5_9EUKA|mmetsp:Transcript_39853/g.85004  ORF Transcript_39853/g.85004 Transcript_39853/m.85004 type:complete len:355 (+) Transcript_39853:66-1130(+)
MGVAQLLVSSYAFAEQDLASGLVDGGHLLRGDSAVDDATVIDSVWSCTRHSMGWRDGSGDWPSLADLQATESSAGKASWRRGSALIKSHGRKLKRASNGLALSSQVAIMQDLNLLHHLAHISNAGMSGETGFASGVSGLAIRSALRSDATHIAIDPFQPAFDRLGLSAATLLDQTLGANASRFLHINETASFALAWLLRRRVCFDFFFMDDGHKFDDNVVELYHITKMLAVGGILVLHDTWLPSMNWTVNYIQANLLHLELVPPPTRSVMQVIVKRYHDNRRWDHFKPWGQSLPKRRPIKAGHGEGLERCGYFKDVKPERWCKPRRSRCRAPDGSAEAYMYTRCNATCNGCSDY